jgi:hypothetical protein
VCKKARALCLGVVTEDRVRAAPIRAGRSADNDQLQSDYSAFNELDEYPRFERELVQRLLT